MGDIRLGGMISGIDVQGTIDKILSLQTKPITQLEEKRIALEADVAAWTDVGGSISALTDALYELRSYDIWSQLLATASDSTRLSATATSSATPATYNLAITQLAQAHSVATDTLSTLGLSSSTDTLVGTVAGLSDGDEFSIEGQTITIEADDTLASLAAKINTAADSMAEADRVTATIIADRLVITRDETGDTDIGMSDTTGTALVDLGVLTGKPQAPTGAALQLEMQSDDSPDVTDTSGNGNDGMEGGDAAWSSSGKYDGGYTLDGVGDFIRVPTADNIDNFERFTFSAWANASGGGAMTIMSYGDRTAGNPSITMGLLAGGESEVYIDDGTQQVTLQGTTNLKGGWHLVTITNDGNTFRLFEDGVEVDTASSLDFDGITTDVRDEIEIGRQFNGGAYDSYLAGTVDEVLIYNRALSTAEVAALNPGATTYSYKNELVAGQDAAFSVNGASVTRSSNTDITDVISGVSLNLLSTASTSDNLTLTVSRDTDTAKASIQDFISSYNAAVTKLQAYIDINLDDPKNPIVGELQGDTLVGSVLFNLRKLATSSKSPYMDGDNASYSYGGNTGIMDSLEDIGVWTEGDENQLYLTDETRLDYMLTNYFDEVEQLFRGVSGESGYEHGVAEDLYDYSYGLSTSLTGQIDKRKNAITDEIDRYQVKIDKMYDDLDDYEDQLWSQFGAMEEAMSRMQSELAWLTSQLDTPQKS